MTNSTNKSQISELDLFSVQEEYPIEIVNNKDTVGHFDNLDLSKNVLICNVKKDNVRHFLDGSAKIYYTGKKFPSTVALNKLFYFIPYFGKQCNLGFTGIRDLYIIKIARVGTRKEGTPENAPDDLRIVFELQFVKRLYEQYQSHRLQIWETFTDTTLKKIYKQVKNQPQNACPLEQVLEDIRPHIQYNDNALTSIDLFSGCGGLTKGFSMVGVRSIFASDIDENAAKTFCRNFPDTPFLCKSITDIEKNEVDELLAGEVPDIIIGGPPCQGFSLANKRRNKIKDDPRNKLFYGFVKFINWYSPKAFVMENVKGLLSMQNGEVIKTIVEEFTNAGKYGYNVAYKVLVASDYGVPQNRERVILIGYRKDLNLLPQHPKPYDLDHLVTVDEAISDLPQIGAGQGTEVQAYPQEPQNDYQQLMRANSTYVLNHVAMKHTPRLIARFEAIKQGQDLLDVWETHGALKRGAPSEKSTIKFHQNNQRLFGDRPAPTIAASFQSNFIHPHLNRNFTAREGARLQSFPDDFFFEGMRTKMSWEKGLSQYQQIGNAVPVLLAKAIAESVVEQLNSIKQ